MTRFSLIQWMFFVFMLVSTTAQSQDKPLLWIVNDIAPRNFSEGPLKGQGINDIYLKAVMAQLPAYDHQKKIRSLSRILQDMQHQNSCSIGYNLTKERQRIYKHSISYSVAPQPILLANTDGQKVVTPHLDANGSLSFAEILKDQKARFVQSESRSFSESMNHLIETYLDPKRMLHVNSTNTLQQIMLLLERRRGNVSVIDSRHYTYLRAQYPNADFKTYPMNDIDEHFHAFILCTNNAWGAAVMKDINAAIRTLRGQRSFHSGALRWMPEDLRESYWQFIQHYIDDDPDHKEVK